MLLRPIRKPHGSPHNSDPIPATIRICSYALWFLMNPNLTKYDTAGAQVWLDMAGKDYASIDPNDFLIITNTSSANNPLALTGGAGIPRHYTGTRNVCDGCLRHVRSSNHSFPPRAAKRIEIDNPFWRRPLGFISRGRFRLRPQIPRKSYFASSGHSHAAPRTPLASPCLATRIGVSASLPKTYSFNRLGTSRYSLGT
jgi:hypothetical protein